MQTTLTRNDVRDDDPPRRRLVVGWALGIAIVVFLVGAILTLVTLLGVRTDLERGRQALNDARRALIKGDLEQSHGLLLEAKEAFAGARDETSGLVAGVARWTPLLGRNVVVVRGLAEAGAALSRAGLSLVGGIQDLPGGVDALAPQAGRLPLEALNELSGPVETSAKEAFTALTAIEHAPSTLLLSPVAKARWDAGAEVRDAAEAFAGARDLLAALPAFAGTDADRRYLFFAQNPAELRSTGGLWGAYSILTIHDGRLDFARFRPITTLRELRPDEVPPPSPDFRRNYDQYGGAGKWRNMNVTPDFPTASRAALSSWLVLHGEMLDGVIAADPFALQSILRVTGPTSVASLDRVIGPGNVVSYVTNEAYGRFDTSASRKEVIGQAAEAALARLFSMHGHGLDRLRAIADAAGAGHIKVFVTEEGMQRALAETAAGGAMEAVPSGDLLAVYVNNASESKVDFYVRRTVSYGIRLGGDLEAFGTTAVTLENDAPTEGLASVVIGPNGDQAEEPGDEVHVLSTWCPAECPLVSAKRDGREILVRQGLEAGRRFYYDFSRLPANSSTTFVTITKRDGVWEGDLSSGSYRLTILPQTTIIPTTIRVRIQAPDGTHIVWTNEPMAVTEGVGVWSGTPESPITLEVRFQASPPLRWLRNVTGLLR